jgi:hypothetical protein
MICGYSSLQLVTIVLSTFAFSSTTNVTILEYLIYETLLSSTFEEIRRNKTQSCSNIRFNEKPERLDYKATQR